MEMIEFDIEELNKEFKKIQKTCLEKGLLIPEIIPLSEVDKSNWLTDKEIQKLNITEEAKNKLYLAYKEKKKTEYNISKGKDKKYKSYKDYYLNEWDNFKKKS